jgi:hypothetical protein
LISWLVQARLLRRRKAADQDLAKDKFRSDKELAEKRFSTPISSRLPELRSKAISYPALRPNVTEAERFRVSQ